MSPAIDMVHQRPAGAPDASDTSAPLSLRAHARVARVRAMPAKRRKRQEASRRSAQRSNASCEKHNYWVPFSINVICGKTWPAGSLVALKKSWVDS